MSHRRPTLGKVVSTTTPAARKLLQSSDQLATLAERMALIFREMMAEGAPFTSITLDAVTDPEIPDWTQLVFTVWMHADFEETWHWWKQVGGRQVEMRQHLPKEAQAMLARNIAVAVLPEEFEGERVRPN